MQSAAAKSSNSKKVDERRPRVGDPDQGSFSVDLWKRAFKDACERLCPVRTGGHECGCLAVIARLVQFKVDISRCNVLNAGFQDIQLFIHAYGLDVYVVYMI